MFPFTYHLFVSQTFAWVLFSFWTALLSVFQVGNQLSFSVSFFKSLRMVSLAVVLSCPLSLSSFAKLIELNVIRYLETQHCFEPRGQTNTTVLDLAKETSPYGCYSVSFSAAFCHHRSWCTSELSPYLCMFLSPYCWVTLIDSYNL